MRIFFSAILLLTPFLLCAQEEIEPPGLKRVVAVENVCAWPNLTLLPDGTVVAIFFNQPAHGILSCVVTDFQESG